MDDELMQRLLARSTRNEKTGCLEWNGARDPLGYGRIRYGGKTLLVHRLAYVTFVVGTPIDRMTFVCHACDNPPCWDFSHLFLGTPGDNSRDMAKKGRAGGQGVTHCPRGHEYVDDSWYGRPNARNCKACAIERSRQRYWSLAS